MRPVKYKWFYRKSTHHTRPNSNCSVSRHYPTKMAFSTAFPSGSRLGEGGGAGTLLISLNSSFKAAYVRTNRVGGAKHMLCFPACDPRVAQCEGAPHCDGHAIRVGVQGRIPAAGGAAAALPKGLRVCAQVVDHANRAKPISKQKPRKVKSQSNRSPHSPPLGGKCADSRTSPSACILTSPKLCAWSSRLRYAAPFAPNLSHTS